MTNSRLQFTANRPLLKFLPTLNASPLFHRTITCSVPYYTAFKLCSSFERFCQEIDKLKPIFETKRFVDICIEKYLDKVFIKKEIVLKAKEDLICVIFLLLEKRSLQQSLIFCKVKVIF